MTSSLQFLTHYLRPYRSTALSLATIVFAIIAMSIATPIFVGRFIDQALANAPMRALVVTALAALVFSLLAQLLSVLEARVAEGLGWAATNDIRVDLTAHVLRLDHAFHTSHTSGELIERVDGDSSQLASFFARFAIHVVGNVLLFIGILAWLAVVDWRIAVNATVIASLTILVMLSVRKRATPAWTAERAASAGFYGYISEYLEGLEDVRAGGSSARSFVLRGYLVRLRQWLSLTNRAGMWGYLIAATNSAVFALALASTLAIGGYLYRSGDMTLGALFVAVRLTDMLRDPIAEFRRQVQLVQQGAASLGRVRALLNEQPSITDGTGGALPDGPLSVVWNDVSFAYGKNDPILRNVSIEVPAGRVLGLIGRTGSGKTTLTRLVPRLLDPATGSIELGGTDIRTLPLATLRQRIGLVSQETNLFDASLEDNLTLYGTISVPDHAVLAETLKRIGLGQWLDGLPDGIATKLGKGGVEVSAGEAQLIACARVLLRDPDIVILDEASARLDPVAERLLHEAIRAMLVGRTGIVIAHRLDTLALTDDIAVLSSGELVEFGSRRELMKDLESRFSALLSMEAWEELQ